MARYSSSKFSRLSARLSSCADYLEAVEELRTMLLHSSPSYLVFDPERLISLVEVAKRTLQGNGISLHTFSSCPDYLSPYKAAYFGLLLQLQAHSRNARLDSKDLQVRLSRLLFPLSTQLKVCAKADGQALHHGYINLVCGVKSAEEGHSCGSPETKLSSSAFCLAPSGSVPAARRSTSPLWSRPTSPPILPPNVMLPPPAPAHTSAHPAKSMSFLESCGRSSRPTSGFSRPVEEVRSAASTHRQASHDTLHFKRRNPDPVASPSPHVATNPHRAAYNMPMGLRNGPCQDDDDGDDDGDDETNTDDDAPAYVDIPARSPLRRSFGIFCTGKGRGAFSGAVRRRPGHGGGARFSASSRQDTISGKMP